MKSPKQITLKDYLKKVKDDKDGRRKTTTTFFINSGTLIAQGQEDLLEKWIWQFSALSMDLESSKCSDDRIYQLKQTEEEESEACDTQIEESGNTILTPKPTSKMPGNAARTNIPASYTLSKLNSRPRACKFYMNGSCNDVRCQYSYPKPQSFKLQEVPKSVICKKNRTDEGCNRDN